MGPAVNDLAPASALLLASDPGALREAEAGGKGMNLARLAAAGLQVPPFFVVGTAAFRPVLAQPAVRAALEGLAARDLSTPAGAEAASAALREVVLAADPGPLRALCADGLSRALPAQVDGAPPFVAVRSSCVGEDSAAASFAGQMDTFLFVRGPDEVARAVQRCWASAFGARALSYRHQQKIDPARVEAAVVVQLMVPGQVSGVLFSASPLDGRRDVAVISATWGLGEGLVSGELAADGYVALKASGELVSQDLQPKQKQVVFDTARGGGTTSIEVPQERQGAACLDAAAVRDLALLGAKIEALYGGQPQDVEWTRREGTTYVLQSRPITKLPPPPPEGAPRVWDNSNIIESYSGVTSPLTFSYIRFAYGIAYRESCELSGVPLQEIKLSGQTFDSMLGLLQGNVYYNLDSWYRLLALFPGFEKNQERMEQMMGVRQALRIASERPRRSGLQKLWMRWCMARNFWNVNRLVREFEDNFRREYHQKWALVEWSKVDLQGCWEGFHAAVRAFLYRWQAPLVTDFCAMLFVGRLKELTVRWGLDPEGALQNDLLCGEGGIESTEPTRFLMRLAADVRKDPQQLAWLEATPDGECLPALRARPELAPLRARVEDYLRRYGFRCMNELKLEEPSLRDRPDFMFAMLKNYARQADLDVAAMERREQEKRAAAEATARQRLGFGPRRWHYWWVLKQARKHVKNRENMRFARTRTYGLLRELLSRIGALYQERGILDHWHDVYWLQLDEVLGFIDGTATCTDLRGLAAVRKAEFARFKAEPEPDDRITTLGAVHAGNPFRKPPPPAKDGGDLVGTPCCPGVVRGRVRVIKSAADDLTLKGEILVAPRTDPGWVPLYPSASGLLIERGSLLSHSAIVARELGLPAIVNIPDLIRRVKDGALVEMDAGRGVVRVLEEPPPA